MLCIIKKHVIWLCKNFTIKSSLEELQQRLLKKKKRLLEPSTRHYKYCFVRRNQGQSTTTWGMFGHQRNLGFLPLLIYNHKPNNNNYATDSATDFLTKRYLNFNESNWQTMNLICFVIQKMLFNFKQPRKKSHHLLYVYK